MRAVLLTVVVLASAAPAESVVLCAKQRSDGTFSSTVKIREACAGREVALDPAALGLQGNAGPSARDSNGKLVGPLVGTGVVLRVLNGTTVQLAVGPQGFLSRALTLVYDSSDCTGTARTPVYGGLAVDAAVVGTVATFAAGASQTRAIGSYADLPGGGCVAFPLPGLAVTDVATFDLATLGLVPPFSIEGAPATP